MTAQTQPGTAHETGEDDADRRAKLVLEDRRWSLGSRIYTDYDDLWPVIAHAIRSAVEAERQWAAGLVHGALGDIKGNPAEMVFYGIALMIENGSDPVAIRARGAGS